VSKAKTEIMSLFLRNLFFTILQPGMVAGLIPYWILGKKVEDTLAQTFNLYQYLAALLLVIGFAIMITCIIGFAIYGSGTLSPADPTKKLVIKGLYRYSRNPMYVGVMLMLIAESIFFQSVTLWRYTLFIFVAFYVFILIHEEPRLKRDFGDEYNQYIKKVRRWF